MSFGFSVGDIILAADLAWRLYKDCREAGERYSALESKLTALSKALASINSTLLHLADSEKAESDRKLIPVKEEHLKPILERCLKALRQLDEILIRYKGRMGQQGEKRYTWGVRRSSAPLRMMVEIPELHHELEICNASLCSLCEVVQLQSCSTISWTFEETQELLAAEGGKCCQEDGTHEISFRFRDTCFECGHTKCEYCGGVPSGTSEMNESQILGPKVGCEVEKKAVNIALADVGAGTVDISTFWLDSPPSEILGHAWLHSFPEVDVATGKPGNTLSQMTTCLPKLMTRGSFETIDHPRTTGPRVYCPTSTSTFARKDHLAQHVRHSHDKARRVTYFECPKHSIHNSLELHNRECPCMADADGYCKKFWNPDMISKLSGLRCLSCFDSESSLHRLMTKLIPRSPNILGALNLGAALGVGGDFLWLNKSMELNHQSEIMNWITAAGIRNIPALLSKNLERTPDGVIFGGFVIATAIFTGTTFAWAANSAQTPATKWVGWAIAAISLAFWMIMGVNPEELVLVCAPLSTAFGILSSCLFGGKAITSACWDEKEVVSVV